MRQPTGGTLVFGIHGVQHALQRCRPDSTGNLYLKKGRSSRKTAHLKDLATRANIQISAVTGDELDNLCNYGSHQGVVLIVRQVAADMESSTLEALLADCADMPLLLLLDQVQDPRNLGACMRAAEAAGVTGIVLPRRNSAPLSAVTRKAASGAVAHLPLVRVANLRQAIETIRQAGIWIAGLDGTAERSIYDIDLAVPLAIVAGSEGRGLRRLTREHCDYLAKIPMSGQVDSLNVSTAVAVALFEAIRQRKGLQ